MLGLALAFPAGAFASKATNKPTDKAGASLPERSMAHRLLAEHEMGELFKVIGFAPLNASFDALGFERGDRSQAAAVRHRDLGAGAFLVGLGAADLQQNPITSPGDVVDF